MLYSDYARKMAKVAAAFGVVKKYKILIISIVAAVLALIATLLGTRGLVYDSVDCPSTIEYGSEFSYRAGAFLCDVDYEFCAAGSTEWVSEPPIRAGKYYVRAVSTRIGGAKSYGAVHEFEITPKKTDIIVADSVVYGETPEYTAALAYGDTLVCGKFEYADITKVSTEVRVDLASAKVFDANGEDVTSSYSLSSRYALIVFTPREIEITVTDATSIYDGQPFSSSDYEITGGTLAEGDGIVAVFDKTQTNVGSTENDAQISVSRTVLNSEGKNVTANYKITQVVGTLTVEKREVVVATHDASHVYDDTAFSCTEYDIADGYSLAAGDTLVPVLAEKITDVGETKNRVMFEVHDADGNDVSENYSIILDAGTLTVQKRDVTLTTDGDTKIYDGTPLTAASCTLNGAVSGHVFKMTEYAELTRVGTAENVIRGIITTADGEADKSDNYNIIPDYGTLEVLERDITITTETKSWIYDGEKHSAQGNFVFENLVRGQSINVLKYTEVCDVMYDGDGNVTTADNVVEYSIFAADGEDVTDCYKFNIVSGKLMIEPRNVTVTTADNSWIYDGKWHSDDGASVTTGSLVSGHAVVVNRTRIVCDVLLNERGEVISYDNEQDISIVNSDADNVTDNYAITVVSGALTINKRDITYTVRDKSKVYDGTPLTNAANNIIAVEGGDNVGYVNGHYVDAMPFVPAEITDVLLDENNKVIGVTSTIDVDKLAILIDVGGEMTVDVTANYNIIVNPGKLIITPRALKLTTQDNEWEYDGDEHVDMRLAVEGTLVAGQTLNATKYTYVTDVVRDGFRNVLGVPNVHEYEIVGSKQTNYTITYVYGTVKITPRKITVETASHEWVYDGNEHYDVGVEVVAGSLVNGHGVRATSVKVIKNVGETSNDFTAEILHVDGQQTDGSPIFRDPIETDNYDITYEYGTLEVTQRPIKIITPSQTWEYDGQPHCELTGVVIEGNTCGDDKLIPTNHTVITDVVRDDDGEVIGVDNVLDYVIAGGDPDNYKITYEYGTLTVTPRAMTVTIAPYHTNYGNNWTGNVVCNTGMRLVNGHYSVPSLVYIKDGKEIAYNQGGPEYIYVPVGTYEHKIVAYKVIEESTKEDKTSNYAVTIDDSTATITVEKRVVKYVMDDESVVYNGQPQSPKENPRYIDPERYWIATRENIKFTYAESCTLTDVGTVDKKIEFTVWHGDDEVTEYYDITFEPATFSVTARPITLVATSTYREYDDAPLTAGAKVIDGVDDGMSLAVGHNIDYEITDDSTITYVGKVANKIVRGSAVVTDGDGKDVTSNYTVKYKDGELEVTLRRITVRGGVDGKTYDGTPLTSDDCTVIYGTIVPGQTAEWHCLGSITDVGSIDNSIDLTRSAIYDKNGKDVTWNYSITALDGTLTVYKRVVFVFTDNREKVYDGTPLYGGGPSISTADDADTGLVAGHKIVWDSHVEQLTDYYIDAATGEEGISNEIDVQSIVDAFGRNVLDNYNIVAKYGRLVIKKRPLLIRTATNEWEYDGETHFDQGYELIDGSIVQGSYTVMPELVIVGYSRIAEPGVVDNMLEFVVRAFYEHGTMYIDLTDNYDIQLEAGTLTITKPEEPDPPTPPDEGRELVRVTAERDGGVYLRLESYGEYNGTTEWDAGSDYDQTISYNGKKYSVNYLTSMALSKAGFDVYTTEIEVLFTYQFMSVLPYYTVLDGDAPAYASDVRYTGTQTTYSVQQYYYSYTDDDGAALENVELDAVSAAIERAYRNYVYENYLDVPVGTEAYLRGFAAKNKLNVDTAKFDRTTVRKVAEVIKRSADYEYEYDTAVDTAGDVVVAFLDEYKEGVCRHYATAATMLYRTLGIPARYVGGIFADTKAGEAVVTKEGRAHAWVEVYIDGIGWVQVEVTGSFDGSGGGTGDKPGGGGNGTGNGDKPGDGNNNGNISKTSIAIMPQDTIEEYSGREIVAIQNVVTAAGASVVTLDNLVGMGYSYTASVSGKRTAVGYTTTQITEFKLFDDKGKDVTSEYEIIKLPGTLRVTKQQIRVSVPSFSKTYDGTPLTFEELFPGYYGEYVESMPDGVMSVEIDMAGMPSITDAGSLGGNDLAKLVEELGLYRVIADDGGDVTDNFSLVFESGGLIVTQRVLSVVAGSRSKVYDGEPLTCDTYSIMYGTLVDGHRLEAVIYGTITDVGTAKNVIVELHVFDADGNEVSENYTMSAGDGTLTVTR